MHFRPIPIRSFPILVLLLATGVTSSQGQTPPAQQPNPFAPPQATVHYAPTHDFDLQNLELDLNIDYPNRKFQGTVVNRMTAMKDGMQTVTLHCGQNLTVASCSVGGYSATFTRGGDLLKIALPKPAAYGDVLSVAIKYSGGEKKERNGIMADSGLHWIESNPKEPDHVGFWTQGEPDLNREWVPTWDYPNDFTTSETRVTVPANWSVVGNGTLRSNKLSADGKTRTFDWQMVQPHATYLLSLAAGPFDIKTSSWRGVPLMYVAPKGRGKYLEDSFGDTPDMLSFYSDITGVKYAWPKYAEDAMYDFGGGMENVSATTLPSGALTDRREGFHTMAGLNAHELAHQWFGDLVTCKDWGHIWLNESFATFFATLYTEHSRGKIAYEQEIEGHMQEYFGESRRYKRPIATNLYPNADAMFDSHTYPKGGVVLHTLRRMLGDKEFFAGLHAYLTRFRHTPVDSRDLCRAMTDATGIDLEPFWDQWIFKPGHPVLDYSWTWDDAAKQVALTVKQTQDTKDGTPIYSIDTKVGLIVNGKVVEEPIALRKAEETFRIGSVSKPDGVLFDPDHDFLREIPQLHWSAEELPFILKYGPNAVDRAEAMKRMLDGTPSDVAVKAVTEAVATDTAQFPAFDLTRLGELKRADLRPFFRSQLNHASFSRRSQAIHALGLLPQDRIDEEMLTAFVNDRAPYDVVTESLNTLAAWDPQGSIGLFKRAAAMSSLHEVIRLSAYLALIRSKSDDGLTLLLKAAGPDSDREIRRAAVESLGKVDASEPRSREALRSALKDSDLQLVFAGVSATRERKDKELLPALRDLKEHPPAETQSMPWFGGMIDETIKEVSK